MTTSLQSKTSVSSEKLNYNKLVHTLTNRSENFESGAFPDNFSFKTSYSLSSDWLKVQKYLMLDNGNTDYYIIFALSILEAFPDIKNIIGTSRTTYRIEKFPRLKSKIQGAEFSMDGIYYSKFLPYSYKFPIPEVYTIKYNSDQMVEIFGAGRTHLKKCQIVKEYGDGTPLPRSYLTFDWSKDLPLKGTLKFVGHWQEGALISIEYVPHSIDIKAWIAAIEADTNTVSFLQKSTLYESYLLAKSPQEKLALLYASLSLQHDTWKDSIE